MQARSRNTAVRAIAISVGGLLAGVALGSGVLTSAQAISASPTVTWSDTSITNDESTSLDYVMGGVSSFVAVWYDNQFQNCYWKNSRNQSFPTTYESARTTTSHATTWWVGLYSTDCSAATSANPPAKADAYASSTLTMTPSGPFGPPEVTTSDTTETGVTLGWVADPLATSYLVYQDDVLVATLTSADLAYSVTGLSAGTTYSFRVVGFSDDFAGIGSTVRVQTASSTALPNTGTDALGVGMAATFGLGALITGFAFARRASR